MALGSNIAERSRKTDLITQITISRSFSMTAAAAIDSVKNYRRKTVTELLEIAKAAHTEYQKHNTNA